MLFGLLTNRVPDDVSLETSECEANSFNPARIPKPLPRNTAMLAIKLDRETLGQTRASIFVNDQWVNVLTIVDENPHSNVVCFPINVNRAPESAPMTYTLTLPQR